VIQICNKAAIGQSNRQISKWLLEEHKITYSYVSVHKLVKKHAEKQKELSEELLRPILSKRLNKDVEILENMIKECETTIKQARADDDKILVLKAIDRLTKLVAISFKVNGINTEDKDEVKEKEIDYNEVIHRFDFRRTPEEIEALPTAEELKALETTNLKD